MNDAGTGITDPAVAATSFVGRRVLVTGASGFIGAAVTQRLAGEGAEIVAVSRRGTAPTGMSVDARSVDVCDEAALRRVFQETAPEYVFHLAGYSYGARGVEHVRPTLMVNLVSTIHVLTLATERCGTRVILAGSQEEAFPNSGPAASYIPNSPYGASKFACSAYARMFHELYGLSVTVARVLTAYGAGQLELRKLLPYVILCFLRGDAPKLSSAKRPMDWVYIDDVVDGMLTVALAAETAGRTIDIGTGVAFSGREAIERIAALMKPRAAPLFGALQDRALEEGVVADTATTQATIGWRARVSLDEGLQHTVAWYQDAVRRGLIDNSTAEPKVRALASAP